MGAFGFKGSTIKRGANVVPGATNIEWKGSSPEINTSDLSNTYQTFIMGQPDPGEITFNLNYDPTNAEHQGIASDYAAGTVQTWTMTMNSSPTKTLAASGTVKDFTIGGDREGIGKASVTIKLSGAITFPA